MTTTKPGFWKRFLLKIHNMRNIKRIFVHCTAGPQTQSVEEIQRYWKTHNKWVNPGYHYIIKPDGEIVQLQPEDKPSNGVAGYNATSINVCYIGGVDKQGRAIDNRTEAQKQSLKTILKELKTRYPEAEILGHREIWGDDPKNWHKMCPCFSAKTEYANIMEEEEPKKEAPKPDLSDIPSTFPMEEPKPIEIPSEPIIKEEKPSILSMVFGFVKLLSKIILKKK